MAETRVGISGWAYPSWRGVFFPEKLPHHEELSFASRQFSSIEINGTFYSTQTPLAFKRWYKAAPDHFVFAVKGPRYLTHIKKLNDPRIPLANFFASGVLALGKKLGPILWQLPAQLKYDAARMTEFVNRLPPDTEAARKLAREHESWLNGRSYVPTEEPRPLRHAIEVRDKSFHDPEFIDLLSSRNVALVVSHGADEWEMFTDITADFVYVRLHGDGGELYVGGYSTRALHQWAEKINRWRAIGPTAKDVYVYFDNTGNGRAPNDAQNFARMLNEVPHRKPRRG